MRKVLFCMLVVAICSGQSCLPSITPGSDNVSTKSATLAHFGYDFSKDVGGTMAAGDVPDSDGAVIGWAPEPTVWVSGGEVYVWWRSNSNTADTNFTKDMGEVTLASVTTVPTTWDGTTTASLAAFQVNHVYVVKCRDGYAKFLVKAINAVDWTMDVDYQYTSGSSF